MRRPSHRFLTAVFVFTLALLVAACGDAEDQAGPTEGPPETEAPEESQAPYNDADVAFLTGMIPHHEQAVAMAEMVPEHTDRPELVALAEDIIAMQQAEITQMQTMLDEANATDGHGGGHDEKADTEESAETDGMDGMDGMQGMMSEEQMAELRGVRDQEFDLLFIDMMIEHHQGAVDSSEQVIQEGENPDVRALAEEIIAAQQEEIDQMNAWREEWAGDA